MTSREAFENWYWEAHRSYLEIKEEVFDWRDGKYTNGHTAHAWSVWQAALATVEQEPYGYVSDTTYDVTNHGSIVKDANSVFKNPLYTHPQPDSKLLEENARLRDALDACLLMCDFSSIPAIETKTKEALKAKGE